MNRLVACLSASLVAACGAAPLPGAPATGPVTVRLRHEVTFNHGGETDVFEGYMLERGDDFAVRAFAGPGVDLFTVTHLSGVTTSRLHITELADRIDIARVGEDIARLYAPGCGAPPDGATARCTGEGGEPIDERWEAGRLIERRYPAAHGVGLTIVYAEHEDTVAGRRPAQITLTWGDGQLSLSIRAVATELAPGLDPAALAE